MPQPNDAMRAGAYAFAKDRVCHGRSVHGRGYDLATHFASVIASRKRIPKPDIERLFHDRVRAWKDATGHLSNLTKSLAHPTYMSIIGLARYSDDHCIERLLLKELEAEPDYWFAALSAITDENPVKPEHGFDAAVKAWLKWGREKRII